MSASLSPSSSSTSAATGLMRVEAARYAVLRRLAFAMRHELVKHLQPIGMVTEVMERRLRAPAPDLAQVHDSASKINGYAKSAVSACLDVITWLAPDPEATLPLDAAVDDCMTLLRSNFSFRGFTLTNQVAAMPQPVGRSAIRMLLPAALLALSDATPGPAEIVLSAAADGELVRLDLRLQGGGGGSGLAGELPYRPLQWQEVEAMAGADDVEIQRSESGALLSFIVLD